MRQFILAKSYSTAAIGSMPAGSVGIKVLEDGVLVDLDSVPSFFNTPVQLVLKRDNNDGGPVILPISSHHFSYVKSEYIASSTFAASFNAPAITQKGEYSIIIAVKGKKFNERNKWTASVYVPGTMEAADFATLLRAAINKYTENTGITAAGSSAQVTLTATQAGVDYNIIPADGLTGLSVTISTKGIPGQNSPAYIQDLASKCAADAGFEYTYRDAYFDLYPKYPLNTDSITPDANTYVVYTLRFAEPRNVKTRDEVVHQIVQIALPTSATSSLTAIEDVLDKLSGIVS